MPSRADSASCCALRCRNKSRTTSLGVAYIRPSPQLASMNARSSSVSDRFNVLGIVSLPPSSYSAYPYADIMSIFAIVRARGRSLPPGSALRSSAPAERPPALPRRSRPPAFRWRCRSCFATKRRTRAGLGYRRDRKWRFELLYIHDGTREMEQGASPRPPTSWISSSRCSSESDWLVATHMTSTIDRSYEDADIH